jgi:hypothetical protein
MMCALGVWRVWKDRWRRTGHDGGVEAFDGRAANEESELQWHRQRELRQADSSHAIGGPSIHKWKNESKCASSPVFCWIVGKQKLSVSCEVGASRIGSGRCSRPRHPCKTRASKLARGIILAFYHCHSNYRNSSQGLLEYERLPESQKCVG